MALLAVGEDSGPWLPKARKVETTKVPQVHRKTVRIAAPECFRALWLGANAKDTPTRVIQTLVGLAKAPASEFLRRQMDRAGKAQSRIPARDFSPPEGLQGAKRITGIPRNLSPQSDCSQKGAQTAGHFQIWFR